MYRDRFFWEDDGLEAEEVEALVHERDRRLRRRIERARDLMAAEAEAAGPRREADPRGRARRGLPARRRALRRLRLGGAAPVRPRHPGRARRVVHAREPAGAVRPLQPREGRRAAVSMEGAPAVADILAWMSEHGGRLRELVAEEQEGRARAGARRRPHHPGAPALRRRGARRRRRPSRWPGASPASPTRSPSGSPRPAPLRGPPRRGGRRDRARGAPPVRHPPGRRPLARRGAALPAAHQGVDPDLPGRASSAGSAPPRTACRGGARGDAGSAAATSAA